MLYRGQAAVNEDGLEVTGITGPNVAEFVVQLEKQKIRVLPATSEVSPLHADYS